MTRRIFRSKDEPIREGLSWVELWKGQDDGLIWCWERGRQYQTETTAEPVWKKVKEGKSWQWRLVQPESPAERCARAAKGELVLDGWRGGVKEKLKDSLKKNGTLKYLATWQGMRGEDLDIDLDAERIIVCSRCNQAVLFSRSQSGEDEDVEETLVE